MSQTIKAVTLSFIFVVATIIVVAITVASAAPPVDCSQAVQNARNLAANISANSNAYWSHRKNFVGYKFGRLRGAPNAEALSNSEKSYATQIKGPLPNSLASFQAVTATVRAQKCLSAPALQALVEPTTTLIRNINFDRFPEAEPEAVEGGPPRHTPQ